MATNFCLWYIKTPRVSLSDLTDIKHSSFVESVGKLVGRKQQLNWLMSIFEHHCWSVVVNGSWLPTLVYLFLYLTSRVIYEVKRITFFFSHAGRFRNNPRCSVIDSQSVTTDDKSHTCNSFLSIFSLLILFIIFRLQFFVILSKSLAFGEIARTHLCSKWLIKWL